MDDEITLITIINKKTTSGFSAEERKEYDAFAEIKNTSRTEFYKAKSAGIEASKTIKVHQDDYEEAIVKNKKKQIYPCNVIHEGIEYKIERAFEIDDDYMELTCSEV